jgi:hypothetical protein
MPKTQFSTFNLYFPFCILHVVFLLSSPALAKSPLAVPVDGPSFHAELVAADAEGQLTFAVAGQQKVVPTADLVCWGQCPEQGRAGGLVLADGGFLAAEVVAADKDRLTAESNLFGTLKLPIESLAGIVFHAPSDQRRYDAILDRLAHAVDETDRIVLDNGDELTGLFNGIKGDAVLLKTDTGAVDVKTDRISAILFNPALRGKSAPAGARSWLGFTDGSRLLASQLIVSGDSLKIAVAREKLAALRSSLVFLQPLSNRVVYLSDIKPAEYRQTSFLGQPWPYQADRAATGGRLRVGGHVYQKGIGVHSAARLVYNISLRPQSEGQGGRAVTRFDAQVAIDDSTAGQGSVIFRVLVDGQERFISPIIRGGDAPVPISVDLRGAKKLELQVDYADRADVLDHADWLDARLTQ